VALILAAIGLAGLAACFPIAPAPIVSDESDITLPAGFAINVFAAGLSQPRFMTRGPRGVALVAERGKGRAVALPDEDGDGVADEIVPVVTQLDAPSSLDYRDGLLYIGESSRVTRVRLDDALTATERATLIPDLPTGGNHITRTVQLGADGRVYVSIGSTCNSCAESDPRRAAVSVYDLDGANGRVFARGLRNAVGLAVEPQTGALWASNNGVDHLGEELPPETIYILRDGADYGWPRCHAGYLSEPQPFADADACDGVEQPAATLTAHTAPLAICFYDGEAFPADYRGDLFVALHGSSHRLEPAGYKVLRIPIADGQVAGEPADFATGWLRPDGSATGRPAGLLATADGALLVSDDALGTVYRIAYQEP
jgi:glucose/arabinose dehydrogenase